MPCGGSCPMSAMVTTCPNCATKLKVATVSAGKKIRCPKCGESFAVRASRAEEEQVPTSRKAAVLPARRLNTDGERDAARASRASRRRQDDDDDDRDRGRGRKSRSGNRGIPLAWLLVGGGLAVLLL